MVGICSICGIEFSYKKNNSHVYKTCSVRCRLKQRARTLREVCRKRKEERDKQPLWISALRVLPKFIAKTEHSDACWYWRGNVDRNGYGVAVLNNKPIFAHRFSWMVANRRDPVEGMFICHHCDNPPCVRPSHLYEGTPKDNVIDREKRGRGRRARSSIQPQEVVK